MKVLIAEDSEDNRFLISAYLRNRPYELTFVRDGREALETFASRYFDLVLMDIQMPVMDGLVATASIRALERDRSARSIPILALSANALLEDSERSQAAGCNGHLSKPISKEKLIAAIESFRYVSSTPQSHQMNTNGQRAKYVIEIPEGFETLSRNYLASRRKEISRLKDLPSGQGLNELRVFGHNMKGTGVSFGFPELTRFGAAIQEAAKACDTIKLADNLHEADEYVEYALATL
jgi:CheY-like chemotaxis protein